MKTPISLQLSDKVVSGQQHQSGSKKHKSYYEQLLQLLLRKTEAEKRAEIFGMDPFK